MDIRAKKRISGLVSRIILIIVGAILNLIGGFISASLSLPLYLDTIGTFLVAFTIGPVGAMLSGAFSCVLTSITFDPLSFFFIPVQLVVGLIAGVIYKRGILKGKLLLVGTILFTIISSLVTAIVVTFAFSVVPAGSATGVYLAAVGQFIKNSLLSIQVIFELIDKALCLGLAIFFINWLPQRVKDKIL